MCNRYLPGPSTMQLRYPRLLLSLACLIIEPVGVNWRITVSSSCLIVVALKHVIVLDAKSVFQHSEAVHGGVSDAATNLPDC
jgi:hypothetical protein